jgi:group I intron endonuclease
MLIYKITNIINGKVYIGQTSLSIEERWATHCARARGKTSQTHIHRAIRKNGPNNFNIEVIDDTPLRKSQLNESEIFHIATLNPEYNMTKGGEGCDTSKSPNYIKAMAKRDVSGAKNSMYGKRGKDNPNYGKKYGKRPNQAKALSVPVMARGQRFDSIGEAEKTLGFKWSYSSKVRPTEYYRLL